MSGAERTAAGDRENGVTFLRAGGSYRGFFEPLGSE